MTFFHLLRRFKIPCSKNVCPFWVKYWSRVSFMSSLPLKFLKKNSSYRLRKRWKSDGDKSGEYGWCGKTSQLSSDNFFRVFKDVCGLALSCWKMTVMLEDVCFLILVQQSMVVPRASFYITPSFPLLVTSSYQRLPFHNLWSNDQVTNRRNKRPPFSRFPLLSLIPSSLKDLQSTLYACAHLRQLTPLIWKTLLWLRWYGWFYRASFWFHDPSLALICSCSPTRSWAFW